MFYLCRWKTISFNEGPAISSTIFFFTCTGIIIITIIISLISSPNIEQSSLQHTQQNRTKLNTYIYTCTKKTLSQLRIVRDSSAVRWLFVWLAGAVGHQSALHKENSGFAAPTLGRHISTFRGYQILFSIRNPYINCFTNHFSIHS